MLVKFYLWHKLNFNGGMKWQIILIPSLDVIVTLGVFVTYAGLKHPSVSMLGVKVVTR
jgi:hypothetical protein